MNGAQRIPRAQLTLASHVDTFKRNSPRSGLFFAGSGSNLFKSGENFSSMDFSQPKSPHGGKSVISYNESHHHYHQHRHHPNNLIDEPIIYTDSPLYLCGEDIKGHVLLRVLSSETAPVELQLKSIHLTLISWIELNDSKEIQTTIHKNKPLELRRYTEDLMIDKLPLRLLPGGNQLCNFKLKTESHWFSTSIIQVNQIKERKLTCRIHYTLQASLRIQINYRKSGKIIDHFCSSSMEEIILHASKGEQQQLYRRKKSDGFSTITGVTADNGIIISTINGDNNNDNNSNNLPMWSWRLPLGWKGYQPLELIVTMPLTRQFERDETILIDIKSSLSSRDRFYTITGSAFMKIQLPQTDEIFIIKLSTVNRPSKFSRFGNELKARIVLNLNHNNNNNGKKINNKHNKKSSSSINTLNNHHQDNNNNNNNDNDKEELCYTFDSPLLKLSYFVELQAIHRGNKLLKITIPFAIVEKRNFARSTYNDAEVTHEWCSKENNKACVLM